MRLLRSSPLPDQVASPSVTMRAVSSSSWARRCSISRLDAPARLGKGQAADAGIDVVRGLVQRGERQPFGERDDAVLDVAILADEHGERLALAEIDEFDLLQPLALLVDQDHAGAARQARQHLARLGEKVLGRAAPPASGHAALDLAALFLADVADLEQAVDEQAKPVCVGSRPALVCGA